MVVTAGCIADVQTPAAVLDLRRLKHNCQVMLGRCRALGVGLRPHLKTLKSVDAARLAIDPNHGGVAVATLNEAEYFARAGFDDIQYAVCITPDKLPRAVRILDNAPRFSFFLDSIDVARAAAGISRGPHLPLRAWIEIDSGEHRTGIGPDDANLLAIAETLRAGGVALEGVATHAGHAYADNDPASIVRIAENERVAVTRAAEKLRSAGFACAGVSAGSTPTATHAASAEGLTELRAGVYMAGDLFQAAIGSLAFADLAFSVVASVISHSRTRNQVVIDAGGLALSKDRSTAALPDRDRGYGVVTDLDGRQSYGDLIVHNVHQEHGEIRGSSGPLPFDRLPIGTKVRVFPNHVCMTAAMYEHYLVIDGGADIVAVWPRTNGWT